ncbi:D-hexose-6-phosphate mutarotase [Oceaniferula spumae]|uniref:Putative glucose-6-phosphate 1-epimerase n=1 Tax=Oceaniferula spumae TaxID=2979115 RepID=A0AAT9FL40_9BACT
MQTINQLAEEFECQNEVWFEELATGYPVVRIQNAHAKASIALHGAHLIDYCQTDGKPLIYTSSAAVFREGKAIRGGIPICWPWFSAHPEKSPSHGYARISFWRLENVVCESNRTSLTFSLPAKNDTGLSARMEFVIGKTLQLTLTTTNDGESDLSFSEALHSYFTVTDSRKTHVLGLDGCSYIDTVGTESIGTQNGPLRFPDEIDQIYTTSEDVIIEDLVTQQRVHLTKTNSKNTITWNPGIEKGSSMDDLANDEIHDFVCVEAGNVRDHSITIPPGESHSISLTISTNP